MGLTDFAGIFSRAFVVGYFLPSFFCLFVLRLVADERSLPGPFEEELDGTEVLVLGGVSILLGLLLSGLNRAIIQALEGYPFERSRGPLRWLRDRRVAKWQRTFQRLETVRKVRHRSPERTEAALERFSRFPHEKRLVLPTAFGNVVRSFEMHPAERYGLDGVTFWPRVELLLEDGEREVITDAQTNLNFFVNALVGILVVTVLLVADRVPHAESDTETVWQIAVILAAGAFSSVASYRLAISSALLWGDLVRSAFDIHRLEVYEKMGLKTPRTASEEMQLGTAVDRFLLFAEPIADELRKQPDSEKTS